MLRWAAVSALLLAIGAYLVATGSSGGREALPDQSEAMSSEPAPAAPPARMPLHQPDAPLAPPAPAHPAIGSRKEPSSAAAASSPDRLPEEAAQRAAATGLMPDSSRPSLGRAYRDRRGLLWGEIRREAGSRDFNDASSKKVTFQEAEASCRTEGNRLPTRSDYDRLVADFGAKEGDGYIPVPTDAEFAEMVRRSQGGDMYPNGGYNPFGTAFSESLFPTLTFQRVWTSTAPPTQPGSRLVFNSSYGTFHATNPDLKEPFLCVFDPSQTRP